MTIRSHIFFDKGITVLLGIVMLLSCKNDMKKVHAITAEKDYPEMSGEGLTMTYSDSAKIKYKVMTPEYIKINQGEEKYEEFPEGIHAISYNQDGKIIGTITAKYARKAENEMIWEVRNEVVVRDDKGTKLETEQLFWDMKKKIIYTTRYARLTSDGTIIEGSNGFKSDQNLQDPRFYNTTGELKVENKL